MSSSGLSVCMNGVDAASFRTNRNTNTIIPSIAVA